MAAGSANRSGHHRHGRLGLLAAACGGRPSSTGSASSSNAGGSTNSPSAVGYSRCMRPHGVPNFPDPDSSGQLPKADAQALGVSSSRLQAAQRACQHMYPNNGGALSASLQQCEETGDCPQAMVRQVLNGMQAFARCMRSRGVPDWPTPPPIPGGALFSTWTIDCGGRSVPISPRSEPRSTTATT